MEAMNKSVKGNIQLCQFITIIRIKLSKKLLTLFFQLSSACEEVDEQKRDVAQWKRKAQKAQSEINETQILLGEQNEKNELLERKFRKVDAELIEVSSNYKHRQVNFSLNYTL